MHFNLDSLNSFSVHHDPQTPKMVDHGVTKMSLPLPLFCMASVKKGREEGLEKDGRRDEKDAYCENLSLFISLAVGVCK